MRWPSPHAANRVGRAGLSAFAVLVVVAAAMASGVLRPLDDGLAALRFELARRSPSREITVVEIDVRSLRAAGRWPWGRERFAQAIANLQRAGARVVAFDVDFSAASSLTGDAELAAAIAHRPGSVVLPTFVQPSDPRTSPNHLVEASPLSGLARESLLASVNVPADSDGRVRRYQYGFARGEDYRPSMGASLADETSQRKDTFVLDYGIDARAIPSLSFEDVLTDRFDRAKVRGRTILIGATALELGDEFATPKGATMHGVFIHALAFESLRAGRALQEIRAEALLLLSFSLAVFLRPTRRGLTIRSLLLRHAGCASALVVIPVVVQAFLPISFSPGPVLLAQLVCGIWGAKFELDRRARSIIQARETGLLHLAMHDPETALPNRRALRDEITAALQGRSELFLAVCTVGIDRYADMRGAVGYAMSNQVVNEVARKIAIVCPRARISHISTSVLGLVLEGASEAELSAKIAALGALDQTLEVEGHLVDAFTKLGFASLEAGDADSDRLLEWASLALDEARRSNRRVVAFDAATFGDTRQNLALMSELRLALSDGHLALHYQPKLDIANGGVTGCEALVRWRHPTRGNIPPDRFIGVAEETGSIRELTDWTLRQAIADQKAMRERGHDLLVSVNVSGRLLADTAFCTSVLDLVRDLDVRLCLEITETAVIENPDLAVSAISAFRTAGLKISIDDYGVGLSSLSYLKMLLADELKIDRSLVIALGTSRRDRLILKSTIDLAHGLGMSVVAEGVESEELAAALGLIGCDMIQGYVVARPMPLPDLMAFLRNRLATPSGAPGAALVSPEEVQARGLLTG